MLSCARALLRARAGHHPPASTVGRLSITITRKYAAASSSQLDLDDLLSGRKGIEQDLIKDESTQTKTSKNVHGPRGTPRHLVKEANGTDAEPSKNGKDGIVRTTAEPPKDGEDGAVGTEAQKSLSKNQRRRRAHLAAQGAPKFEGSNAGQTGSTCKSRKKKSTLPDGRAPEFITQAFKKFTLPGRVASGIVATSRPHEITIEELTQDIEIMPKCRISGDETVTSLVILLTPGLAKYALNDDLSKALYYRLGPNPTRAASKIHITSAVVDRLPAGLEGPGGSEGMAYLLMRDVKKEGSDDKIPFQESAQKPGSLTFQVTRIDTRKPLPVNGYEFQLPLAQTVFTTGSVSTLISRTYVVRLKHKELRILSEEKLEKQTLQLPTMDEKSGPHYATIPLVPLTPFRKINYVMGNIIRKLSSQDLKILEPVVRPREQSEVSENVEEDMPASQELEKAVSEYFEKLNLQPETVSVWAFVLPRKLEFPCDIGQLRRLCVDKVLAANAGMIQSSWSPRSARAAQMSRGTAHAVRLMIPQGGRLIKVLSGGGGWGKKAGLLSLDPDVKYSTRELRQDDGWEFDFGSAEDDTAAAAKKRRDQALGQIVKKGDRIMFLLAPKSENLPTLEKVSENENASYDGWTPRLEFSFGTIPSSVDVVPQSLAIDADAPVTKHYPNCFGMLSEGGMAVTAKKRKGTSGQSKIDVPFSNYNFRYYNGSYFAEMSSPAEFYKALAAGEPSPATKSKQNKGSLDPADVSENSTKKVKSAAGGKKTKEAIDSATKLSDMFESFAELDETEEMETDSVGEKQEPGSEPAKQ